ncbi:Protein CBR-UNC-60 [Dirofilaria immitis]|nr:Protein CBR-UNC-60 [Dirofilaria immitis]
MEVESTSGVSVNPDVQRSFQRLSDSKEYRYILFKIEDREVVVEAAVTQDELDLTMDDYETNSKEAFGRFIEDLRERTDNFKDCRYAVFDFKFTCSRVGAGTSKMDKIVFLQICPDGSSIKKKMVYASSASAIKASLGTEKIIQFQASGVKVDASCKKAYDELHQKHQHSYIIFRISDDDTTIIVDKIGSKNAPYSEFVEEIRKSVGDGKECRYAAVDVEVQVQRQGTDAASRLTKITAFSLFEEQDLGKYSRKAATFCCICPDEAPVRRRMLYASSVRALKATLGLESLMQVQASDISDIDEKAIKHELMSHQRT